VLLLPSTSNEFFFLFQSIFIKFEVNLDFRNLIISSLPDLIVDEMIYFQFLCFCGVIIAEQRLCSVTVVVSIAEFYDHHAFFN